jgi:hypothetical protein
MQGLQKIIIYVIWAIAVFFFLLAVVFSSQVADFLHSTSFLNGFIKHGLAYYQQSKDEVRLGGSDYLPGLYILLQVAIFPGQILGSIFHLDHCTIFADKIAQSCLIETVSLKAVTVFLATVWILLLQRLFLITAEKTVDDQSIKFLGAESWKKAVKPTIYLLSFPPILYSIFFFGAYDGLGAFFTLIGGLLYFNSSVFTVHGNWRQRLVSLSGLMLASIGISAKFFPFVLLLGTCIAFSKKWKDLFVGIGITLIFTFGQIWITQIAGGNPLRILQNKATGSTSLTLYPPLFGILLLLLYSVILIFAYNSSKNRLALGSLAALGIFSILFPSILWHPQWQIYYGICLVCSYAIIMPKGRIFKILITLFVVQALAFVLSAQFYWWNADITMAFSMVRRDIVPYLGLLGNSMPAAVIASFRQQPLGKALQIGWITYSLTQILILACLTVSFLRSAKSKAFFHVNPTHASLYQSVHFMPGIVFILSWYSLVLVSIFFNNYSS